MRNYEEEIRQRTAFIRRMLEEAHGEGIVFGNNRCCSHVLSSLINSNADIRGDLEIISWNLFKMKSLRFFE